MEKLLTFLIDLSNQRYFIDPSGTTFQYLVKLLKTNHRFELHFSHDFSGYRFIVCMDARCGCFELTLCDYVINCPFFIIYRLY